VEFGTIANGMFEILKGPIAANNRKDELVGTHLSAGVARKKWLEFLKGVKFSVLGSSRLLNPLAVGDNIPDVVGLASKAYTESVSILSACIYEILFHSKAGLVYHSAGNLHTVATPSVES
jgi:hypothetical protein